MPAISLTEELPKVKVKLFSLQGVASMWPGSEFLILRD